MRSDERTGVLNPANLGRYDARWTTPAPEVGDVVDHYWGVGWQLDEGESIDQQIIDLPAITLTIEEGDVPAPLVVTGLHSTAWTRTIRGRGEVFAIRLRPAGLAVVSDLSPDRLVDATTEVTPGLDPRLHRFLRTVAGEPTELRATAANAWIARMIDEREPTAEQLLANAVVTALVDRVRSRTGPSLAHDFSVSERSVQRALRNTLGKGPKWVARRIRLQEAARVIASEGLPDLSTVAAELGYTDQAHLINDFRRAAGITPGAYVRSLRDLDRL